MILFVELVFLLIGYVPDGLILLYQFLDALLQSVAGFLGCDLQTLYDVALLLQVFALFRTGAGTCCIAGLEELVAGSEELVPQLVAQLLGHHADGLPLLLQVDELVAGGLPVGRVLQGLCLLDEGTLLVGIHLELLLEVLEELCLASEEVVTGCTEALEYLDVHLLGGEADGLPLCLQFDNLLGATLPVCAALVFLGYDGFDFLAEGCLLGQVLLFLGAQIVVVLLETLVDNG